MFGGDVTRTLDIVVKSSYKGGMAAAHGDMAGLAKAAGAVTLGLGGAALAATAFSIKSAAGFEQALTHVKAFAGASDAEIAKYRKAILSMAPTLGLSATQMAEGLYNLASAGVKGSDAMTALTASAKAASASHTDLSTVTGALTTVINSYGLHGKQIKAVMDDMTKATLIGRMEFGDYANSLGQVIPVAQQLGINMKTIGGLFADLTNRGNSSAETGILLKNTFDQLLAPTSMQKKEMAALGLTMKDFSVRGGDVEGTLHRINAAAQQSDRPNEALRKLFGGNLVAMRAFLQLMGDGGKTMHGYLTQMAHDAGTTETALKKASGSTQHQWDVLKATVEVIAIEFGSKLLPAVNNILKPLSTMAQEVANNKGWFGSLTKELFGYTTQSHQGAVNTDLASAAFGRSNIIVHKHAGLIDDVTTAWFKATHNGKDLRDMVKNLTEAGDALNTGFTNLLRPFGLVQDSAKTTSNRMNILTGFIKGVTFVAKLNVEEMKFWAGILGHAATAVGGVITSLEHFKNHLSDTFDYVKSHNPFQWLAHHIPDIKLPGWVTTLGNFLHPSGNGGGIPSFALPVGTGAGPGGIFGGFGGFSANYQSSNDVAMLQAMGIAPQGTVMDTDFPSSPQAVKLPGGGKYFLNAAYADANVGGVEVFGTQNGGTMAFLHLQTANGQVIGAPARGSWVNGGTPVGISGHALTTAFGNDPSFYHLCVVTDALGRASIGWLTTGQMTQMANNGSARLGGGGGALRPTVGTVPLAGPNVGGAFAVGVHAGVAAGTAITAGPLGRGLAAGLAASVWNPLGQGLTSGIAAGTIRNTNQWGALGVGTPDRRTGHCAAEQRNEKHHAGTHKNTGKIAATLDDIRRDWHRNQAKPVRHGQRTIGGHHGPSLDTRYMGLSYAPGPGH